MLRDEAIEVAPTWAQEEQTNAQTSRAQRMRVHRESAHRESAHRESAQSDASYREIDRQLRRLAKQKARLEIEEAKWLREAERLRVWRKLGYSTALEYLEDVFGYAPRTAMERLRVAKELGELPALEAEVRSGALPWSAARELTRVMTPATESRWLERARGKNVHDIGLLVSGHRKGDDPEAPNDPALMTRRLVLELPTALDALFEKTRLALETERGEHLDDLAVFEAMCMCALEPGAPAGGDKASKPMHRIVSFKCDDCARGWREGRGRLVPITAADIAVAACDAELVNAPGPAELATEVDASDAELFEPTAPAALLTEAGSGDTTNHLLLQERGVLRTSDGKVRTKRRPPPTLTIPKATRDFVWARDHGRCRVPGCRATRYIACHHLEFRSHGGDHHEENLLLLCAGHHQLLHDGLLTITGRAPDELIFMRGGRRLVDARSPVSIATDETVRREVGGSGPVHATKRSRFEDVVIFEHAKQALMQLGFKARAARAALNEVCAHVGADDVASLDVASLVKAVLDLERNAPATPASASSDDQRRDAVSALVQLGYARPIASAAVEGASAHVSANSDLASLIKEALRRCSS
jgi:Holliday junction resolvasome RuvABC DNA-binding subunit